MTVIRTAVAMLLIGLAAAGCARDRSVTAPPPAQGGYLAKDAVPDSVAFLPPPPDPGSLLQKRDADAAKQASRLKDGPRWTLAARDADLTPPQAVQAFSCAAGVSLDPQNTPKTVALLSRAMADLSAATGSAKSKYARPRPFMVEKTASCTPESEAALRKNGSYPSGHSAIGWGWGLILAELIPERTSALVLRARAFAQSRVVCNAHWVSDTEASRVVAAAAVSALHADAQFRADLDAARAEMQARATLKPADAAGCAQEAETLSKD